MMLIFALKLMGKKTADDRIDEVKSEYVLKLSEWDIANIIRILKTRNQTLYRKFNDLYDGVLEEV